MPNVFEVLIWCFFVGVVWKLFDLYDRMGEIPEDEHKPFYEPLDPGEYNPYTKKVVGYPEPEDEHERRTR